MSEMNWTSVGSRLKALVEELDEDGFNEEGEDELLDEEEMEALCYLLGVEPEQLAEANEEQIMEALTELGYKIISTMQYGRPGLSGKYPWDRNESPVGKASPTVKTGTEPPPGTATAKVPKQSPSKFMQRPTPANKR
jgi:hypothetical protein